MADMNEEKKSRVVVSLISVGVVLVIGFPVWWNTTKVYRATLPYAEIQQLENLQFKIKVALTIIFEQEDARQNNFLDTLSKKLNNNNTQRDGETDPLNVSFFVSIRKANTKEKELLTSSANSFEALDDSLQELWKTDEERLEYKFIVLSQQEGLSKLVQCFVGKYRHAIVLRDENQVHLADVIANVTQSIFLQQGIIKGSLSRKQNNSSQQESIEQIRELKSITGFHLSFSLINDEPETGIVQWNIQDAISEILQPLMDRIAFFDVSVDSQVLFYSGVNLTPRTDGEVHYLTTEDLPHMINPIEGKLGSFVSLNPSLNFIIYVPPKKQTPLKIRDQDGLYNPTNAFLSPRWGGVLIYNVYDRSDENGSTPETISLDVTEAMKVFLMQIRLLVGIKTVIPPNGVIVSSVLNNCARDWEVDNLLLAKTTEYLSTSVKTLTSLTQLITKVKNMIIDDNIKTEIENALLYIAQSQDVLTKGRITQAFMAAKIAIQSSEKAFYDPSVLELLYFPDDQKFAIYIPLFLPISLPLLVSLFTAIKWLRNKDNEEKDKKQLNQRDEVDETALVVLPYLVPQKRSKTDQKVLIRFFSEDEDIKSIIKSDEYSGHLCP